MTSEETRRMKIRRQRKGGGDFRGRTGRSRVDGGVKIQRREGKSNSNNERSTRRDSFADKRDRQNKRMATDRSGCE